MNTSLYRQTPSVTILNSNGNAIRDITYHRHPAALDITDEYITYHQYDSLGFLVQSADPRLHQANRKNFTYLNDLKGNILLTQSADAGINIHLNDIANRPFLTVNNLSNTELTDENNDNTVTISFQYEETHLLGRPTSITEQISNQSAKITERFIYVGHSKSEQDNNLIGQCIRHYDTAGMLQINSLTLTKLINSFTQYLLKEAHDPDVIADWQGTDHTIWDDQLAMETYTTLNDIDATGTVFASIDAQGHRQQMQFNVAEQLSSQSIITNLGFNEIIIKSLDYSAAGQKKREEHGNGVVVSYCYEMETQRLIEIKTQRPIGHQQGAKILQDLRYEYDPVGNVVKISNDAEETRFWRNQKIVPENSYSYDSLYQLVTATGREMANTKRQNNRLLFNQNIDNIAYTNYTRSYSYDCSGNLIQIKHHSPEINNNYTTNITVSPHSNRAVISELTDNPSNVDNFFTENGQQTQLSLAQKLTWTTNQTLLQVTPDALGIHENYRYNSENQRVLKISTQIAKSSLQILQVKYLSGLEIRETTRNNETVEHLQVICIGQTGKVQVRLLHWDSGKPNDISNDQLRYSYQNLTGSSTLELNNDGNIITQEEYYPYGGTAIQLAENAIETDYKTIRYSGKERDITVLYHYPNRYYQPWIGRWLSTDPAHTIDGLNLYNMVGNNPISYIDNDGLVKNQLASIFSSDSTRIKKGYITPLQQRGLFVGSDTIDTSLRFDINRYDSVESTSEIRSYTPELLASGGTLDGAVSLFNGTQATSTESGSGTIGIYWGKNQLSSDITGINVVNGMSGSVGIRIPLSNITEGSPIIVTSGALSGCTMLYSVDSENFYAVHTGQKPGDDDWKTGAHGISTTQQSFKALSGKDLETAGMHNNDLIDMLNLFERSTITYLGKEGTRIDRAYANVTSFDYNQAEAPKFAIRAGYSYALLANNSGKTSVKVLSEDVIINRNNSKITLLNSMKVRLQ